MIVTLFEAEAGLMEANPRRALRYACALSRCVNALEKKAGSDFWHVEAKLIQK